jgi:hypothetical protein
MARGGARGHDRRMATDSTTELLQCAEALEARVVRGDDIAALAGQLDQLAGTLRVVAQACERGTTRVVPPARLDVSVSHRYQSAVARWPFTPPPSYERLAMLLGSLHDAAAALRVAAGRCESAKDAVHAAVGLKRRAC